MVKRYYISSEVKDLHTGMLEGFSVKNFQTRELIRESFKNIMDKSLPEGTIIHSDHPLNVYINIILRILITIFIIEGMKVLDIISIIKKVKKRDESLDIQEAFNIYNL